LIEINEIKILQIINLPGVAPLRAAAERGWFACLTQESEAGETIMGTGFTRAACGATVPAKG